MKTTKTNYTIEYHSDRFTEPRREVVNDKKTGKTKVKRIKPNPETVKGFKVIEVVNPNRSSHLPGTWLTKKQVLTQTQFADVVVKIPEQRRY
jgi:hypothetical protein